MTRHGRSSPSSSPGSSLPDPASVAAVGAGGLIGTALRYGTGLAVPAAPGAWPWATFTVNVVGAFVLSALLVALRRLGPDDGPRRAARLAFGTGLLGAFTTYSGLALEEVRLVGVGSPGLAVAYGAVSVLVGLAAAGLGILAGRWVTPREPAP
ncbi:fluoride efflux transporter FluC [Agilicoccus flavus]|uniref:fluoride efflux transporter FluC n=1 Tax=Agilicoccus flavus TaxID=2775968 RepID=UPI001CF69653|nr:CrcB family protein [Agilicoccus flavus]